MKDLAVFLLCMAPVIFTFGLRKCVIFCVACVLIMAAIVAILAGGWPLIGVLALAWCIQDAGANIVAAGIKRANQR